TDEFYRLSQDNDYIKTRKIAKNKHFSIDSKYGKLEITINLSKPENTRQQMEAARATEGGNYPVCALCMENEGYRGRAGAAARSNHRIVRLPLFGENWGFQYSPYSYYNEHCIILSEEHVPMHVTEETIANLLEIVTLFPHYFIGSNAGLPIVGGSILSHEHYQGGRHHFPMEAAKVLRTLALEGFPEVEAEVLFWPLSVIRLRSEDRDVVAAAACTIMEEWQNYNDPQAEILAESAGMRHNAVTLVARRVGEAYELDVVLRNNRTSEAFPDGIFHPHPDVQHIKKENIGLIEVLGLAILPPRLDTELNEVADYLLGKTADVASCHREWAEELKQQGPFEADSVMEMIQEAVGEKFLRVIEDAGVYKQTPEGQAGFYRFLSTLENK
ncbi:MAG: UDP-glucose--hexose-1-phosphate uridylyltransferase, partial [Trichococcus flocculiformis]